MPARIFRPDRSFATSDEQYAGQWRIDDKRLTVEYWEPFQLPSAADVDLTLNQLRKIAKTYTVTWQIEIAGDNQTHTLIFPDDHVAQPGERWQWIRQGTCEPSATGSLRSPHQ